MSKVKKSVKPKPAKVAREIPTGITRILALDLSENSTGWCRFNVETGVALWGTISNTEKLLGSARLDFLVQRVLELVAGEGAAPARSTFVAIENFSFGSTNRAHDIGMVHGVIRLMLYKNGFRTILIAPTLMKKWVTGKGSGDKNLILKYIDKRYGYDCDQEDAADALGLMTLTRAFLGFHPGGDEAMVSFQTEALETLKLGKD